MSVPQDIRAVPRPKNTVVTDTGGKGPLRYCVRARTKAVRTAKGFQPRNGKVIGHIVDGAFVPVSSRMKAKERRTLGCALLVADLGSDLRARLAAHLGDKDADIVLALASLDILYPDLGEDLRAAQYKASLASLVFPGLDLSEKSIHALYTKIGKKGADELFRSLGQANGSDTSSYLLLMPMECPATLAAFGKDACKDNGPGLCLALQGGDIGFEPVYGRLLDMKGEGLPGAATCCDTGCTLFTASEASSESLRSLARERGLHYLVPVKRDDKLCKKLSFDRNQAPVFPQSQRLMLFNFDIDLVRPDTPHIDVLDPRRFQRRFPDSVNIDIEEITHCGCAQRSPESHLRNVPNLSG